MNVRKLLLILTATILPQFATAQDGVVEGPGRVSEAPAPGQYQLKSGVQGVMVYAQPPGANPPDCNANPGACLGYVVPSGEMIDCNQQSSVCNGTNGNQAPRSPVARVHFSYWDSPSECQSLGGGSGFCERNKHFLQFGDQSKINSGEGYILRREVDALPYRDKHHKLVSWGQYDAVPGGFDEKAMVKRALEAEKRFADEAHHDHHNEVVVSIADDKPSKEPANANNVGCPGCEKAQRENDARLLKEAQAAEAKAYSGDGCVSYPFTLGCSAQSSGNGFGFLAHPNGNQCAICFTQQVTKGDFCGDPRTMPVYKIESMAAMLVKKSANLCRAAADQFSKMCSPWKTNGTPELRKAAVQRTEAQLIQAFHPDESKVLSERAGKEKHLKKSPYLTPNLMACLLDREDITADPAVPNFTLCNDTEYKRALYGARAEVKALKKAAAKSKKPDYDKIQKADAELHTFENQNDSGPHDRPFVLGALKRYHEAYLSSATGLDMVTRSTVRYLCDSKRIFDNQCAEFKDYWSNIDRLTNDPIVKPFFSKHQCKEADSSTGPNGENLFAERLFGLKSKDPTVQLEVGLETFNYHLNLADDAGGAEAVIRKALTLWFGKGGCSVNEVYACKTCMDNKGTGDKTCLELTHPSNNACGSVKTIVQNQIQNEQKKKARATAARRKGVKS